MSIKHKPFSSLVGIALLPVAFCTAAVQAAENLNYSYLEAEYVFGDEVDADVPGVQDLDVDGVRFKGSAALTDYLFVWGSHAGLDLELPGTGESSLDIQSLGVGVNYALLSGPNQLDAWGGVSYERIDPAGSQADGYGLSAGLRWKALDQLELNGTASYREYDDFDGFLATAGQDADGWIYGVGAVYNVTPRVGLVANWEHWELDVGPSDPEVDLFSVGGRWNF
ncbi:MAG: TonB-dependent receptor [Pseudomonadota bacterium]